jgi:hypothetical protein
MVQRQKEVGKGHFVALFWLLNVHPRGLELSHRRGFLDFPFSI